MNQKEVYIRYKKKQELLNRKKVSLLLDKDIANTLQEYMRRYNRVTFEHQLKSHFLKKPLIDILHSNDHNQTKEILPHVNILIAELQKEIQEMNHSMDALQKKLETLLSEDVSDKNPPKLIPQKIVDQPVQMLNRKQNIYSINKIPNVVLELAISLYETLNSWQKVCKELAKQGYLSRNNSPYTASSLSRAVSKYKSNLNT